MQRPVVPKVTAGIGASSPGAQAQLSMQPA